ncbi:DJ-1/PfpI family protein [Oryzicola mucosus]|uniref:DJ-1/PfpI family protein n=1 Tax=Oryzicola mucosus TaxID=2767425 RepID=A0A8J6PZ62_9HYPH|nr:DJ-1/PfpI family protein [Oryzicola mucosus]MBD0417473.1 DJ-1/PfpI family protein [Oryzicola mucosus]
MPVSVDEQRQTIRELRPPKRSRPLVAILADNRGSETTDLMVPYAVLSRAGIADVIVVAPDRSPIIMMPALSIEPQATLDAFDQAHPGGADYVVVPAFHHDERDGPILKWLQRQAASHATIVGICEGARVLGRAGLLDGRHATTHWYAIRSLQREHPSMQWVRDRRYVVDRGVVTTTGVTASIPLSLALVEAIAGPKAASALGDQLGVTSYDVSHQSERFSLNSHLLFRLAANGAAIWNHETVGIPVADGVDDIALSLTADAWSRTYRSQAITIGDRSTITTRSGLTMLVDRQPDSPAPDLSIAYDEQTPPAQSLHRALSEIASRYGERTAALVALQLEFAWSNGI